MKTISLILCLLSFLFCKEATEISEIPESHLEISYPSDPVSLDPIFSTDLTSEKLIRFLHSPLFRLNDVGDPVPMLVDSYSWNGKKKVFSFRIKSPLESGQVVHSLNRLMTTPGPRKDSYSVFFSAQRGKENDVVLLPVNPAMGEFSESYYLTLLSLSSSAIIGKTGPYILKEWNKGNSIQLKLSSDWKYFDSSVEDFPETIRIRIIPQSTSGIFLFSKNQLDSVKLSDFLLTHPIASRNTILQKKGRSVQYVAINMNRHCFDSSFREALNLSIDRKKIIEKILENQAELTYASIPISRIHGQSEPKAPRSDTMAISISEKWMMRYEPKLARQKLEASVCYPEILKEELEFRMRGDDENQSKGRAVAEYLKELGLQVKIIGMEKAPLYRENGEGKGDLTFLTWYADYESPLAFLDPVFHSQKPGNGGNRSFYNNPDMDEFIQTKNIDSAISDLIRDQPWIFLWSITENYVVSEKITKKYPRILEYL